MEKITKTVSVKLPDGSRCRFKRNNAHYRYEYNARNVYVYFTDKGFGDKNKYHCSMNVHVLNDMVCNIFGLGNTKQEAFDNMLSRYVENVKILNRVKYSLGVLW